LDLMGLVSSSISMFGMSLVPSGVMGGVMGGGWSVTLAFWCDVLIVIDDGGGGGGDDGLKRNKFTPGFTG